MATVTQTLAMLEAFTPFVKEHATSGLKYFNLGSLEIYIGNADPNGTHVASKGAVMFDLSTPAIHQNTDGSTTWTTVTQS